MDRQAKWEMLAGDPRTGKIGAKPLGVEEQAHLPHEPLALDAESSPTRDATDLRDPGYVAEEPGSILGNEREGVPQGDTRGNVGGTQGRTRAQTDMETSPKRGETGQ